MVVAAACGLNAGGAGPAVLEALVARGCGLALVPVWWRPTGRGVVLVPLVDPPLVHRVEVLLLRSRADRWTPVVSSAVASAGGR